jgi:hypothetical protein
VQIAYDPRRFAGIRNQLADMWKQLKPWLEACARQTGHVVGEAATLLGRALLFGWEQVRPAIVLALNIVVALVLLFEEWGWRPLSEFVARLARFRVWAMVELWIAGLPPYGALLTLAVPSAILIPAKFLGVYLLATGHFVTAGIVIIAAKLASTALIARIFLLTQPALMQIGWFARAHDAFVPWKDALFARIRASWAWRYGRVLKWRADNYARGVWFEVGPQIEAKWRQIEPRIELLGFRVRSAARDLLTRISLVGRRAMRHLRRPDAQP